MQRIVGRLRSGGALVIGLHEELPAALGNLEPWAGMRAIYRKAGA